MQDPNWHQQRTFRNDRSFSRKLEDQFQAAGRFADGESSGVGVDETFVDSKSEAGSVSLRGEEFVE